MVRPWVGWLCILVFIAMLFYLYLSINAPIIRNPYALSTNMLSSKTKESQKFIHSQENLFNLHRSNRDIKVRDCSTLHVALVCAGYNSTISFITTAKSILFYRTKPLHFHLLVDDISLRSLNVVFNTWNLPHVTVSYYKTESWVSKVSWIPNKHYSGVYGLLKLILPDSINEEKVIVLDTDVTVLNDISLLWKFFEQFNDNQVLGLIENQSNWYTRTSKSVFSSQPWPAVGKGFNTGVMLMNLQKLRAMKFNELWKNTASTVLQYIPKTSLADQDIINAVIKNNPNLVFAIDCTWNVQLSDNALSETCYTNTDQINIVHWNSPRKQNVKNKHAQDFRKMHQIILELDGNLLRRKLFGCPSNENIIQSDEDDSCSKFREGANIIYRTHPFYFEFEYNIISNADVVLAAQCSTDRMALLEDLSKHWDGPISVALYLSDADVQTFIDFVQNSAELRNRKNIAYHIVYKEGEFYPVNYLRNVAMKYMTQPFIFQLDIDFLPQMNLHKILMDHLIQYNLTGNENIAFVVPAFETQRYRFTFPMSKADLLKYLELRILYTFRYHVWYQGHAATNYSLYQNATEPYEVSWEPDFEPFVVVPKSAPAYDVRFLGFGWNKVSYITHLTAIGYRYVVLPDTFIIHRPHAPSRDIGKFRTDATYRRCLKQLKDMFVRDLIDQYGDKAIKNLKIVNAKENKSVSV
ncbi:hypothetical protein TKK_0016191 [Trichogramma kaykai]|uniref:Glycosyltransferase-like protein LARGE1 n=1 Tax=Trichogramma kaykai TaxID=54128 RepID=A0ABD2W8L2_9HYME